MHCTAYRTDDEAQAAVARLIAAGTDERRISVITGHIPADHREERVGAFAGDAGEPRAFAGTPGAPGSFASVAPLRAGGFGDVDRDEVSTFDGGVRRVHVASHHELERRLQDAGLDPQVAHDGRVLVLVS